MVVGGTDALVTVGAIRRAHPDLFIMCDPHESANLFATAENPFPMHDAPPGQDSFFPSPTLADRVQGQIGAGASVALTPTGYVQAHDHQALRAVINQANLLDRDDVVVLLPLDPNWLADPSRKTIIAAIERSRHPVAITLGDSNGDPMSRGGVLKGARELCGLDSAPMFHKTDLVGYHLMACGAVAASVGLIASKRRASIPGKAPFARRSKRGPNILLPDLLRFRRSLDMQDQWFASRNAPRCPCRACKGQPIDRFGEDQYDSAEASQHNAIGLLSFINEANARGGYHRYWPAKVHDALAAHVALSALVGTQIQAPREVKAWE
jgi:hypothetical protein